MLLLIFHKKVIALRLGHSTERQSYNNCRNGQRRGKRKSGTHFTCAPLTYQLKPTMWTGNISYTTQYVLFSKPYLESYISNLYHFNMVIQAVNVNVAMIEKSPTVVEIQNDIKKQEKTNKNEKKKRS